MTVPDFNQTFNLADHATAFVARTQVFYNGEDFVEVSEVSEADLAACADDRFVQPGGQWPGAEGKLDHFGALIVTGERGTGRRTAALRLLSKINADGPIYELVPTWSRPNIRILPPPPGGRCLLDMSEPTEKPPSDEFGKRLVEWAQGEGICLVVITTDEAAASNWVAEAEDAAIQVRSPNARDLAIRELRLTTAGEQRISILSDPAFDGIWQSHPRVVDTLRLVSLIGQEPFRSAKQIADEYQGWRTWIDETLSETRLGSRTLLWAAAFCEGGQRGSVLRMSEDLRRRLREDRGPAAILGDAPASTRLKQAKLNPETSRAEFDSSLHGISAALRVYLWREFDDPPLRELLTQWLVAQLGTLPDEDAARLGQGVLDIATRFRDDRLLRTLRDQLTGDKQRIAVRLLSQAAVDPQFGTHVRSSLYNWAKDSRSQADLVAAVCGAEFGKQQPDAALVRLGWAAQKSGPGSPALADAIESIATHHPAAVLESIAKWLGDKDRTIAGINTFLALASTDTGAVMLCDRADPATGQDGFRNRLIDWFQRAAIESDTSYQATIAVYRKWKQLSDEGTLSARVAIPVLGRGIEPALGRNPMRELHPGFPDTDDFMTRLFTIAIRGEEDRPTTSALDKQDPEAQLLPEQAGPAEAHDGTNSASAPLAEDLVPETGAEHAPPPAPDAPGRLEPTLTAPGILTPPQAAPGHDANVETPVAPGPMTGNETDPDVQTD